MLVIKIFFFILIVIFFWVKIGWVDFFVFVWDDIKVDVVVVVMVVRGVFVDLILKLAVMRIWFSFILRFEVVFMSLILCFLLFFILVISFIICLNLISFLNNILVLLVYSLFLLLGLILVMEKFKVWYGILRKLFFRFLIFDNFVCCVLL